MTNKYTINNALRRLDEMPRYVSIKKKVGNLIIRLLIYVLLIEFVFVFMFPYLYMILNSLKYEWELRDFNREWVITQINTVNYRNAVEIMDYWIALRNTLLVVAGAVIGHVLSCSFIAYGLARFKFWGRSLIMIFVTLYIIIPPQLLMMPLYIQYSRFGWIQQFTPIIVPTFFGFGLRGGLFIFIFRQFFKNMPRSYEEAAKIEGCGPFKLFWNIIIPMSKTSMILVMILSTVWHWNDSFQPQAFLANARNVLLVQRFQELVWNANSVQGGEAHGFWISPEILAGCVLMTLPLLIIYFIFQKQFMQGIEMTGLAN
jgi:multiple sugar transport system permease protein